MTSKYFYNDSIKSTYSDELINTYFLRPAAGVLVRIVYHTPITPNHLTVSATVVGCCAAFLYAQGTPLATAIAGVSLMIKDLLDSADGQLARAKQSYSRAGRFLDSIGDFLVNMLVFAAIGWVVGVYGSWISLIAFLAFAGTTLRVSYHVFYQTSYLHLRKQYSLNRITEQTTEADRTEDNLTRMLHSVFLFLYGWQDRLMARLDTWSRGSQNSFKDKDDLWYGDKVGLRLSGMLGMGTELFLLTLCSLANELELYLVLNLVGMNLTWCVAVVYRRVVLGRRLALLRRAVL